jgi:hypothetical protein
MAETENPVRKPKKQRSPNYPALDLDNALSRTRQLWNREGRHYAPVKAMLEAWGYGPKSSGGLITIGALKRFGLLEDKGAMEGREARLTEFAQAIILDEREDSTERMARIQEAALKPAIHREVWDRYDGMLPSDSTLRYYLTVERGFTEDGADDFIKKFKRTLEFAQLTAPGATVSETNGGTDENSASAKDPRIPAAPLATRIPVTTPGAPPPIQFPVFGATVILQTTAPLTESAWDQMMAVLNTLKPAVVVEPQIPDLGAQT